MPELYKIQERAWTEWSNYADFQRRQRIREEQASRAEEYKAKAEVCLYSCAQIIAFFHIFILFSHFFKYRGTSFHLHIFNPQEFAREESTRDQWAEEKELCNSMLYYTRRYLPAGTHPHI